MGLNTTAALAKAIDHTAPLTGKNEYHHPGGVTRHTNSDQVAEDET